MPEFAVLYIDELPFSPLSNAFMSCTILRSVVTGLTACLFLVLFSGCGTEKSSATASPDPWPASTWKFDSIAGDEDVGTNDDGDEIKISLADRFTFSGGNSGIFNRTISINGATGPYTYTKTGHNTGALLLTFVTSTGNVPVSVNLIFNSPNSGTGTMAIPPSTEEGAVAGGRIYRISFSRI